MSDDTRFGVTLGIEPSCKSVVKSLRQARLEVIEARLKDLLYKSRGTTIDVQTDILDCLVDLIDEIIEMEKQNLKP